MFLSVLRAASFVDLLSRHFFDNGKKKFRKKETDVEDEAFCSCVVSETARLERRLACSRTELDLSATRVERVET